MFDHILEISIELDEWIEMSRMSATSELLLFGDSRVNVLDRSRCFLHGLLLKNKHHEIAQIDK